MKISDTLSLSFRTVRSNKLRTGITVAIIAFGIMALIGIITAIEAMNQSLKENFSSLGANAFSIRFKERNIRIGHNNNSSVKATRKGAKKEKVSNVGKPIKQKIVNYKATEPIDFVSRPKGYWIPASCDVLLSV